MDYYKGKGEKFMGNLPEFHSGDSYADPSKYIAEPGLRDAVNVALTLGMPLLLTGDPGTGKTQLAYSLGYEFEAAGVLPEILKFNTKTTSLSRELFYRYDSLAHFRDVQLSRLENDADKGGVNKEVNARNYINYEALGLAILLSLPPAQADPYLPEALKGKGPLKAIVLIDEVDKAPRDLPNDVLHELENLSFTVRETGESFKADMAFRPIIIMTSNSEKNLPDAFMRRCVFYHIGFPDQDLLKKIVNLRMPEISKIFSGEILEKAINHFMAIRKKELRKKPATAELLAWIHILAKKIDPNKELSDQMNAWLESYPVLAKNKDDLDTLTQTIGERLK